MVEPLIDSIYRQESRRVLATLVRILGDLDLAEEALQEAFVAAAEAWPTTGMPDQPRAWLVSTARFKAIDAIRRRARLQARQAEIAERLDAITRINVARSDADIPDDRLRLIFTCCHPAISPPVQIALTLREVCGLTTEEIASAFLTSPSAMAQRIVRGKAKIREAGIPYVVPENEELAARLEPVLSVIYLVFSEGYSASSGSQVTRSELSTEAIRLARLLIELLPDAEAVGLLALMLLQESRRAARSNSDGDLVLLEDQDRSLWDQEQIAEGLRLVAEIFQAGEVGPYGLQAAIAAEHARAASPGITHWPQIVSLYDVLLTATPSPVIALNRAVAISMRDGPAAGLDLIDGLLATGELSNFHLAHAARAELLRKLRRFDDAREAYQQAICRTTQEPEQRFLQRRLVDLTAAESSNLRGDVDADGMQEY